MFTNKKLLLKKILHVSLMYIIKIIKKFVFLHNIQYALYY